MLIFSQELIDMIVDEWNFAQQYAEDEPLDGDEIDLLVKRLSDEINLHQGNITEDELDELTEGCE